MAVTTMRDVRKKFVQHLKEEDRSWLWFHKQIVEAANKQKKQDENIPYSRLYYTLKGAHAISEQRAKFWNEILGTDF
jgi:hypothetical protein